MGVTQPWNIIFLFGFVIYMTIRGKFASQTKDNELDENRVGTLEKILLIAVMITALVLPMPYLFTPLLSFADYFALRLDPIYGVHWNNGVDPIHYELSGVEGASITPQTGDGPQVEAKADLDPREFLVDVKDAKSGGELQVTLKYFCCTDDWCKPFTQTHTIVLERDSGNDMSRPGQRRRGGQREKRRQRRR